MLACRRVERRRLLLLILVVGLASIFLDIAQIVQGVDSPLRFYSLTDVMAGDGFFANRNHNAAFLYSLIPLAALVLEQSPPQDAGYRPGILFGLFLAVALGLTMLGSRAALGFGAVSAMLTYVLILRRSAGHEEPDKKKTSLYVGVGGVILLASLLPAFGLARIWERLQAEDVTLDARWTLARVSLEVTKGFFPFGSGLGLLIAFIRSSKRERRFFRLSSITLTMTCWK